jgi:hypothetical protein
VVSCSTRPLVTTHLIPQMVIMVASQILRYQVSPDYVDLILHFVCWITKPTSYFPYYFYLTILMAPVVRIDPNGSQALLSHDDVVDDLVAYGWDGFMTTFTTPSLPAGRKVHAHSHRIFFFSTQRTLRSFYFLIGKSTPTDSLRRDPRFFPS